MSTTSQRRFWLLGRVDSTRETSLIYALQTADDSIHSLAVSGHGQFCSAYLLDTFIGGHTSVNGASAYLSFIGATYYLQFASPIAAGWFWQNCEFVAIATEGNLPTVWANNRDKADNLSIDEQLGGFKATVREASLTAH